MAHAEKTNVRDSDLMQLADGELDAAQAAELEAVLEPEHRAKMAAIGDLGHAVRGHLELSADDAAPRMARMWDEIDKRISLDARAATPTKAIPAPARGEGGDEAAARGFWGRLMHWFDDHRSQIMTGVLSAGAVAAVTLFLSPRRETIVEKPVYVSTPTVQVPGPGGARTALVSTPPSVDTLDVTGGSGTVFTIEDEDGGTAVIWVTPEDTVEGL